MKKPKQLTPFGVEVKKKLLDIGMTQKEFCQMHGIPESRFSEILYGARPGTKYREIARLTVN